MPLRQRRLSPLAAVGRWRVVWASRLGGTAKDVATATDAFVRAAQVLGLTLGEIRQIITFRDRAAPRPAPT